MTRIISNVIYWKKNYKFMLTTTIVTDWLLYFPINSEVQQIKLFDNSWYIHQMICQLDINLNWGLPEPISLTQDGSVSQLSGCKHTVPNTMTEFGS